MVLSAATLAKDTPLSSCVGRPSRKGYTFFLIVSVDTLDLGKDPLIYLVASVAILSKHPLIF